MEQAEAVSECEEEKKVAQALFSCIRGFCHRLMFGEMAHYPRNESIKKKLKLFNAI